MTRRSGWTELPDGVRRAVSGWRGAPVRVVEMPFGVSSHFAATLHYDDGERVFIKGMRADRDSRLMMRTEAAAAPHVEFTAPKLLADLAAEDWRLLAFEFVEGSPVDLGPGSSDLARVASTLGAMQRRLTPGPAVRSLPLAERWRRYRAWEQINEAPPADLDPWLRAHLPALRFWDDLGPKVVDGETLAHADLSRYNILAGPERLWVIDWARAGLAAPWVDTAFMVLRLINGGHTPAEAVAWAEAVPGWEQVTLEDLVAWAVTVCGIREIRYRSRPSFLHLPRLAADSRALVRHLIPH